MDFKNQYKHPLWQKLRLQVLEGYGYKCCRCGDTETQLHVHHPFYRKGAMIWEYTPYELECLCDSCHTQEHELLASIKYGISLLTFQEKQLILNSVKQIIKGRVYG